MLTSIAFFGYTTNSLSIHLMEKFVFFPVFDFYNIAVVNIHSCISLVNMYFHLSCFLPISGITVMPCPMPKKAIVSYILWFLSVSDRMANSISVMLSWQKWVLIPYYCDSFFFLQ